MRRILSLAVAAVFAVVLRPAEARAAAPDAILGRVIDAQTREPVAGATVLASSAERAGDRAAQARATTDERGAFAIETADLDSKKVALSIESDWHYLASPVEVEAGAGAEVTLEAKRGGRVVGTLLGPDEKPRAGAAVWLQSSSDDSSDSGEEGAAKLDRRETTSEDGSFAFGGVPEGGAYEVSATGYDFAPLARGGVRVLVGEEARVDLLATAGGAVAGIVRDGEGNPLAYAVVWASSTEDWKFYRDGAGPAPAVRCGSDGRFVLPHLNPGPIRLTATAPVHWHPNTEEVKAEIREGATAGPVELVLRPCTRIAGVVVDDEGNPVEGVNVRLHPLGKDTYHEHPPYWFANREKDGPKETRTGEDGSFRFEGIRGKGPFGLGAYMPPFAWIRVGGVAAGTEDLRIVLELPGGIAGIVVDAMGGEPVRKFTVTASEGASAPTRVHPELAGQARTGPVQWTEPDSDEINHWGAFDDPEGKFSLHGLAPGRFALRVAAQGYVDGEKTGIEVARGEVRSGVIVSLERKLLVSGRVLDPAGAPVEGAKVHFRSEWERADPRWRAYTSYWGDFGGATTEAEGRFVVDWLKPGSYEVLAQADGFARSKAVLLEFAPGEHRERIELRLRAGGSIYGTVSDPRGTPLEGWMVFAFGIGAPPAGPSRTGPDGGYELRGLETATYMVALGKEEDEGSPEMSGTAQMRTVHAREGERIRVDLVDQISGGCRVHGVVRRSGRPWPDASVVATKGGEAPFLFVFRGGAGSFHMAEADGDGRYEFKSLPPGGYEFRVGELPFDRKGPAIEVEVPDLPEFVLDLEVPGSSVAGRVLDAADGEPIERAVVRLAPAEEVDGEGLPGLVMWARASTTEDGSFLFEGVPPGAYALLVEKRYGEKAYAPARVDGVRVEAGQSLSGIVARLESGGSIRLRLVQVNGEAVMGALAELERDGKPLLQRPTGWMIDEGTIEIVPLGPGVYDALVISPRHAALRLEGIAVRAGEVAERMATLERGIALSAALLDSRGRKVEDATFEARDASGRRASATPDALAVLRAVGGLLDWREGTSDPDRLGRFAPGRYRVVALHDGKEVAAEWVELFGEEARALTLREK